MRYLKISNKGEMPIEALTLLGASTKRGDNNKIGYFGSGNKFAIAYFMRNNYSLHITSGLTDFNIGTNIKEFNNQEFKVITVNKKETSITDEFGADWVLWKALRELYSNALDEGEADIQFTDNTNGVIGVTSFFIELKPDVIQWYADFNNYFSENKEVLFENSYGKILKKHNDKFNLYRRGIRVYDTELNSIYDYDLPNIRITEDRVVDYVWDIDEKIWKIIYSCTDKQIIRHILNNSNDNKFAEKGLSSVSSLPDGYISEEFKEVLKEMQICNSDYGGYLSDEDAPKTTLIPRRLYQSLSSHIKDENKPKNFRVINDVMYKELEINEQQADIIRKATEFLKECQSLKYIETYDLKIGVFDNKNIRGLADVKNKTIIISELSFLEGLNWFINVLIEEYVHIHYGSEDETRQMQDNLITELIGVMQINNSFTI